MKVLISWVGLLSASGAVYACLAPVLDERAVQWSTGVVQARVVSVGKPVSIDGDESHQPQRSAETAGSNPVTSPTTEPTACGFVLYTLEVTDALDGTIAKGDRVRVIRLTAPDAPETSKCPASLKDANPGDAFVLLLRPATQTPLSIPRPDSVPPGIRADALVVVHAIRAADVDAPGIEELRRLVSDARRAERSFTPDEIAAQAQTLATAADDVEAADAEKALMLMGPSCTPALTRVLSDPTIDAPGRARVRRVLGQLEVPALGAER
jgi:hypothetical protein